MNENVFDDFFGSKYYHLVLSWKFNCETSKDDDKMSFRKKKK